MIEKLDNDGVLAGRKWVWVGSQGVGCDRIGRIDWVRGRRLRGEDRTF